MANLKGNIHYDGEYISSLIKMLSSAKGVLDEALDSLKSADRHEGWECSERVRINDELREISKKLESIKNGIDNGASAMSKGAEMFASLENQASTSENAVSEQVKKNWFFEAIKWVKGGIDAAIGGISSAIGGIGNMIGGAGGTKPAPITPIYPSPELPPVTIKPGESPSLKDLIEPGLPGWVPKVPDWLLEWLTSLNSRGK